MQIYFRACEKQETISYVDRWKDVSKTEIVKKCWLSLQKSITEEDRIVILHDSVSQETLDFMSRTAVGMHLFKAIPSHDWDYHLHTVELINLLEEECKRNNPRETFYLVEDDYLHTPDALHVIRDMMKYWGHFGVPYDYPDRYKNPEVTQVFIGPDRHWRTVASSTMTVFAHAQKWLEHIDALKEAAPTSNDQVFKDIYKKDACLSPLPGIATHLTPYHMTPLIDWNSIWTSINIG